MNLKPGAALALSLMVSTAAFAQSWEQMTSFPGLGRHHPVTFTLDGFGYLVTGSTTPGSTTSDDFFRYDPVANSWAVLPDFPGPDRSFAYGVTFDGKAYMGFGFGTNYLRDLWQFDPQSGQWTELAPCPGVGRTHPAFIVTDAGKIFAGCGQTQSGNLRDWWEYDIASNLWTRKLDLPGAQRHHPYYFNIGDIPYVCFGHGAGIYKDIYRFDPVGNTWTRMADFPGEGRVAGTQFSRGGKGYVLSGEGEDHDQFPTGEFHEYDPVGDSWTALTPHPGEARWAPGTFQIGDAVYMMGGLTNTQLMSDVWRYRFLDPASAEGSPLADARPFLVFPNPTQGRGDRVLRLASGTNEAFDASSVRLFYADGREVAKLSFSANTIQIPADVAAGRYFVTISAAGGQRYSTPITVLK